MITTLGENGQNVLHLMHVSFAFGKDSRSSRLCFSYLLVSEVVSRLSTAALEIVVTSARDRFPRIL